MGSQLDLDQGGTYRETIKAYLGPSIGWVEIPSQWIVNVVAAGTTTILNGTNLILVNVNGAVTIQLPSFKAPTPPAIANPARSAIYPITICDIGGFAVAHPITILPFGTETISGLASLSLASNFGSFVIRPDTVNGGGTLLQ